jgi:hypothetical protein
LDTNTLFIILDKKNVYNISVLLAKEMQMIKLRDVLIFLAGVTFFHTINHVMLPYFVTLPWDLNFMTLTLTGNYWIIAGSALVTILLLWWASRLPR